MISRHGVPFTVYVPTAFPDGFGEAWWLALEQVIAGESRICLMMGEREQRFVVIERAEKQELFTLLEVWLRTLPPAELSVAINDLCKRHRVDLAAVSREASMDWSDLSKLAADPLVTIGSATVNYAALATMKDTAAARETAMGKAVAETAFHREIGHFAYPFGDRISFRRSHMVMAEQAGFASAASTIDQSARAAPDFLGRPPPLVADAARARLRRDFPPVKPTGSAHS